MWVLLDQRLPSTKDSSRYTCKVIHKRSYLAWLGLGGEKTGQKAPWESKRELDPLLGEGSNKVHWMGYGDCPCSIQETERQWLCRVVVGDPSKSVNIHPTLTGPGGQRRLKRACPSSIFTPVAIQVMLRIVGFSEATQAGC